MAKSNAEKSKKAPKSNDLLSKLAWRRSIIVSNGTMRGAVWAQAQPLLLSGDRDQIETKPLIENHEKGVTGRKDQKSNSAGESTTFAAANNAFLTDGCDSVLIEYDMGVANSATLPHSIKLDAWKAITAPQVVCVDGGAPASLMDAILGGAPEIFRRVAERVFDGTWAWRNHEEALRSAIVVHDGERQYQSPGDLAQAMLKAFSEARPAFFKVSGLFQRNLGSSMPVYPSQLLLTPEDQQGKGKAAQFYRIPTAGPDKGDFGLRAVKIGNRLRAIDDWYRMYDQFGIQIPVEPMGYAHNFLEALRTEDEWAISIMRKGISGDVGQPATLSESERNYLAGIVLFGGLLTSGEEGSTPEASTEEA